MTGRPITEEDLHGLVDGALEPARATEVSAYLETHPDVASRIGAYAQQRTMLRAALAPIAEEPLPPELDLARMIARRGRPHTPPWWGFAAAAVVLLFLGGAGGWSLRGGPELAGVAAVAQEAADNYAVYSADQFRPVELRAPERGELVNWATQRLGRPVAVPDLAASGYRFMGGRIIATAHGPAAMFMYDDDRGTRMVLLTRPMAAADRNAPMTPHTGNGTNGYAWADNGLGYSLVSPATPDVLHPLADEVRRQVSRPI